MESMDEELEQDSIYANSETSELINVSKLLQTSTLDELLLRDKQEIKEKEKLNEWYHGRIDRNAAEEVLNKGTIKFGNIDGLFLVRESSFSSSSFVLSILSKGLFYHFQVNEVRTAHFSIDDGPIVQGLDKLIQSYQEAPQGLPAKLTQFCKCKTPPEEHRAVGPTNLLHRAVLEDKPDIVNDILRHSQCPSVNAKNDWGSTALHDACYNGFEAVADILIRNKANVEILDKNCHTPLHRCCTNNKGGIVAILIQEGHADINARSPKSGWTPLHQAAFKGHTGCIRILLDYHAPYLPRADDGTTPVDLAENYENRECLAELENFEPPKVSFNRKDWFHPEIDRNGAQQLLELKGLREGLFIIRCSKKNPDWYVLTICHKQKVFHYEIRTMHYRDKLMFYIDDGPFFRSIEHMIQYYSYHSNGLPCAISMSVNPAREVVNISVDDDYYNLTEATQKVKDIKDNISVCLDITANIQDSTPSSPVLPPRPPSLSDDTYSDPVSTSPKEPQASPPPPPNHPPPSSKGSLMKAGSVSGAEPQPPKIELKRIDRKLIKLAGEIGQGEFGSVKKGVYKTQKNKKTVKIDVAVKLFHQNAINNQEDFLKEARTMQQLQHECIVNFLGISETDQHELMLVEEFIEMGSMLDYLIDYPEKIDIKKDLYLWAAQIALGMMYLEQKKLVHRDLAARNILLQNKKKAKISDFGLSRAVGTNSDYYQASTGGRWPIKWYAPECVNYGHFSHASDVWSFGITLWEMFSFGEPPYGDMKGIEVIKFIEEDKRLAKPEKCESLVYRQMLKCWSKQAKDRPTFKELNTHFEGEDEYMSTHDIMKAMRQGSRWIKARDKMSP